MSRASTIERRVNREVPVRLAVVNRRTSVAPLAERLDEDDLARVRTVVWEISHRANGHKAIAYTLWKRLREVTGVPAPHPFTVDHLPAIVHELRRCWEVVNALAEARDAALQVMTKRLIVGLEEPGPILAALDAELHAAATVAAGEAEGSLASLNEAILRGLQQRVDPYRKTMDRHSASAARPKRKQHVRRRHRRSSSPPPTRSNP